MSWNRPVAVNALPGLQKSAIPCRAGKAPAATRQKRKRPSGTTLQQLKRQQLFNGLATTNQPRFAVVEQHLRQ